MANTANQTQSQPQPEAPAPASQPEQPKEQQPEQPTNDAPSNGSGDGQGGTVAQDKAQEPDARPNREQGEGEGQSDGDGEGDGQGEGDGDAESQQPANQQSTAKPAPRLQLENQDGGDHAGADGEDGDQEAYSEMKESAGGGMLDWAGLGGEGPGDKEDADADADSDDVARSQDDGPSFPELSGGLGAGLLGLNVPGEEPADPDGGGEPDSGDNGVLVDRPAKRERGRRQFQAGDDPDGKVHRAAQTLGQRGGIKSGQSRRIKSIKIKKPETQPVSQGDAPKRRRPPWFNPPRLPGMKA